MSAAESLYRRFGRLELPLARTRDRDLLALDPARLILLDLIAEALTSELEPVWSDAVIGTPLMGKGVIEQRLPALPEPEILAQMKAGFPLLAVAPATTAAAAEPFSIDQEKRTRRWDVDYILCPLALANEIKLRPVLTAVDSIVRLVVSTGGHRAYLTRTNDNFTYAANVLTDTGEGTCGFHACRVVESAAGVGAFAKGGPPFLSAGITLETEEISDFLAGDEDGEAVPLQGATATLGYDASGTPGLIARS